MAKTPKNNQVLTFIYTLSDPDTDEIRYIGKTVKSLKQRLTNHIYTSKKINNHRCNWIKSIINRDKKPLIKLLDSCQWNESQQLEEYWINQFKNWGFNLVNATDGGEGNLGLKLSKERKDKLVASVSRIVYQYDLQGNFINEYSSVAEAARSIGYKSRCKIGEVALGRRAMAANYQWSYVKLDKMMPYKRTYNKKQV